MTSRSPQPKSASITSRLITHSFKMRRSQPKFTRSTIQSFHLSWQFFKSWLRIMIMDLACCVVLGVAAILIFKTPPLTLRMFPVTFRPSGAVDIVFPTLAYPFRGWIIDPWLEAVVSIGAPLVIFLLAQARVRSFWDLNNAVFGLLQSHIIATLFSVITKQLIGGFRPFFLDVCNPKTTMPVSGRAPGLAGSGFCQVMYTTAICTQPDEDLLKLAVTSFPSGHATSGCAGFVFLFLYMNGKLKVWSAHRPAFWKLALTVAPLLCAWLNACVLTVDQAHHWYDVAAGGVIGTAVAFASYRTSYASIFDARFNHIPLSGTDEFAYSGNNHSSLGVFTTSAGWGKADGPVLPVQDPAGGPRNTAVVDQPVANAAVAGEPENPIAERHFGHLEGEAV